MCLPGPVRPSFKVVLVIAGGLKTFRDVRDALDPTDLSTGTSVPVRAQPLEQCPRARAASL